MRLHNETGLGRRVRIESGNDGIGHKVTVKDADTGEAITNVACAVIYLAPDKLNQVELTYWAEDEQGQLITVDGEIIQRTAYGDDPEIALTAYEAYGRKKGNWNKETLRRRLSTEREA